MKLKKISISLIASMALLLQVPMAVLADTAPTDTSTPTSTATTNSPSSSSGSTTTPTTTTDPAPAPTATDPGTTQTAPASSTDPSTTSPTTSAPSTQTGAGQTGAGQTGADPNKPTGSAPSYAFNDITQKWEPTIVSSFSWDPASQLWVSPFYYYEPKVGWYHVVQQAAPSAAINSLTAGSADPAATMAQILGSDPSNSNTGPNSTNNATLSNRNQALLNLLSQYQINNNLKSAADSGNVTVDGNTNALGTDKSGAATVVANLLSLLNSMWSWAGGGLSYFVHNVMGDQNGDIHINPVLTSGGGGSVGALPACAGGVAQNDTTGPTSTNNANSNCQNDITVNNQTAGAINNNLNLNAKSGDVGVTRNTNAGDAISGDAAAELNLVNLINTAIGAQNTFFGMINIFGNLNGDILFPQGFLDSATSGSQPSAGGATVGNSNTGPGSTNDASASNNNNLTVNNNVCSQGRQEEDGQGCAFNNDINAKATSGNVNVSGNTTAGSAVSGDATTNTDTFNLFNTGVFGDNAVLVLVNVMGHWMGQIMNLGGDGSSAALLTGNATVTNNNTGPSSTNNAAASNNNDVTLNNNVSGSINNHINATAQSGDVTLSDNTNAGNARSGNAKVATNVANFFGSTLNLKKWFGILVINVFGDWFGSVNKDTSAGNTQGGMGGGAPVHISQANTQTNGAGGSNTNTVLASANVSGGSSSNITDQPAPATSPNLANVKLTDHSQQTAASHSTGLMMVFGALSLLIAAALFSLENRLKKSRR